MQIEKAPQEHGYFVAGVKGLIIAAGILLGVSFVIPAILTTVKRLMGI